MCGGEYILSMCIRRGRDRTGWVEEEMAVTDDSCKGFALRELENWSTEGRLLQRDQHVVHAWFPRRIGNWCWESNLNSYEV